MPQSHILPALALVVVEWEDSYLSAGWREVAEVDTSPLHCYSVGWIVHETPECIVLAPHVSQDDHTDAPLQANGMMIIPRRSVIRREPLAQPSEASS